ncbi:hypothetical protein P7H12_10580 [Paenibacillus larvae]|nr:hypothetical protein [Paenibacillus larvae]MDT2263949.1 hypothetical protein [Paenibacillus larvae]
MRLKDILAVGEYFLTEQKRHKKRIERYKENQKSLKALTTMYSSGISG